MGRRDHDVLLADQDPAMRLWGVDPERDRWHVQALRAEPPGFARESGARRTVFGAALEQWDALIAASTEVSAAASPILIFYALAQASQALCASRVMPQPWRPSSHGLSVGKSGSTIGATTVEPTTAPDGAFALVCRAVGSAPLSAPTSLDALWASNPHLVASAALGDRATSVLRLDPISGGELATRALLKGEAADGLPQDPDDAAVELRSRLVAYPSAIDGFVVSNASPRVDREGNPQVEVGWRSADGTLRAIELAAPGLGPPNSGAYLFPELNADGNILHPFALWWVTLLVLSSLARYHPDAWRKALARDRSAAAIPIQQALDTARHLLPWLLLHELRR